jgi:hypothetical protein
LKPGEKVHGGKYSSKEYKLLTDDQKEMVRALRETAKKQAKKEKRKAAALQTEESSEGDTDSKMELEPARKSSKVRIEEPAQPKEKVKKNAGDQFGRAAHKAKKASKDAKDAKD